MLATVLMVGIGVVGTAPPIIDMHLHGSPSTADYEKMAAELAPYNVVLAMVSGPASHTMRLEAADPDRFITGVSFPCTDGLDANLYRCFEDGGDWPDINWLRAEIEAGRIESLGELNFVAHDVSPSDSRMMPYYALAAEFDLPVAVHVDRGPRPEGRKPGCCPNFNEAYADPALYEPVLERFPNLRLYLMHVIRPGSVDAAVTLMARYPRVYVDTSPMSRAPYEVVIAALQRLVEAGYADRVMFGSDYRGGFARSVEVIETAPFLTDAQKRGIFHDNAVRFLGP